jgi:hypothetical protein
MKKVLLTLMATLAFCGESLAIQTSTTKDIIGYGESRNGRYYLIASPIGNVRPGDVSNMLNGDYDLYYFDQSEELEWRNYKAGAFDLVPGKGYLYANREEEVTLTFIGYGKQYDEGDNTIELDFDESSAHRGVNLIGNPFDVSVTVNRDFYVLNEYGDEVAPAEDCHVEPMQGFFVIAEGEGETATLEAVDENDSRGANFILNLRRAGGGVIDRAIVRFGEGRQLPKFQLRENSTKLFIPQNGQNYAVVSGDASAQMPVSFKAEHNGSYTINLSSTEVEFSYLHLVDLIAGKDIDLLANPDYTFDARTTDDVARFRLDYVATNVTTAKRTIFRENFGGGTGLILPEHDQDNHQDATFHEEETTILQTIPLVAGWNWVSFNVDITLDDLKNALVEAAPGTEITIQLDEGTTTYNNSRNSWEDDLTWNVTQIYMIKVEVACEITLEGMPIAPAEHLIINGDNWIGFPFDTSMGVADAFAEFALRGDMVLSHTAFAVYTDDGWKGTLTTLEPGQGYIYTSASYEDRTFTFPIGECGSISSPQETHWQVDYHEFQYQQPLVAFVQIDGEYCTSTQFEVGAFDNDGICSGAARLADKGYEYYILEMPIYYNPDDQSPLTFRLWNHEDDAEVEADFTSSTEILTGEAHVELYTDPGDDYGNVVNLMFVTDRTTTQTITLTGGTWNWVSFNVVTDLEVLKTALVAAAPDKTILIKSQTQNAGFIPGRWRGQLRPLDISQMYMIKVEGEDNYEITLEGNPIDPVEHPITIKNGANWIAFPFNTSMNLTDAFAGFAVNNDEIKASNGSSAKYQGGRWRGQLSTLEPGQGYIYKSASTEVRTLVFPTE